MNITAQRQAQLVIRAHLLSRLVALWPILSFEDLNKTLPQWLAAVIPVVQDSRKVSALLAATYLREARKAAGIEGTAPIVLADAAPQTQLVTSLTVTSLVAVRTALGAGQIPTQAMRTAFVTSSGSASRLALDGGRQTILDSVRRDPKAKGWQRVTSGTACDFCEMLAGRGAVYREDTADFEAHDHCACVAEPLWQAKAA